MENTTAGYVTDIDYTFGYYPELSPLRAKFALESKGFRCPEIKVACELGFGQGLSTNIHAAATDIEWWGTDFNASQASLAREMAEASGSPCHLFDEAFAEFCNRPDLPDFDFIGLHGIWSWISEENHQIIVDFIARKLKVGGVLYMSYNTFPGWFTFAPMRHLMSSHAEIIGAAGKGILSQIDGAMDFAEKMLDTKPQFLNAIPMAQKRLAKVKEQNRHYVAHEYFNQHWHPVYFLTMAEKLESAKMEFACSAHYLDHVDQINLTDEQRKFLAEIPNAKLQQSVRDFMVNQAFRRDYWVKGLRPLNATEQEERVTSTRLMLTRSVEAVEYKTTASLGEVNFNEESYKPVIELLADHKPRTYAEILSSLESQGMTLSKLLSVVIMLTATHQCRLVQDIDDNDDVVSRAKKLNRYLINLAKDSEEFKFLASPVIGGGVTVNRIYQLFLLARCEQVADAEQARYVWNFLKRRGHKLRKEGEILQSEEDTLAHLQELLDRFNREEWPVMEALKMI